MRLIGAFGQDVNHTKLFVNSLSILIKFSQKTSIFTLIIISSPLNHMFWMCIRIASILIHIHNISFYGEISKFFNFYHFDSDPRFPPFLYGDVSVIG